MQKASVVDLFCGAGGLSYGFKKEGFHIAAGVDVDSTCRYPYESNCGRFIQKSVEDLTGDDINNLYPKNTKTRILIGCAPCQAFSSLGKKGDGRWSLVGKFADIICDARPDFVCMENVPRLLTFQGGEIFQTFLSKLEKAGYFIFYKVIFCPDYGLPQKRKRLIFLASKKDALSLIPPTHNKENYVSTRDAIGSLPRLESGQQDLKDPLHKAVFSSSLTLKRIKASKSGGSWQDWPKELLPKCRLNIKSGYSNVYGRMEWDTPSPTITTQFNIFSSGRFAHPEQDRTLSIREGAILQGFPLDYTFTPFRDYIVVEGLRRLIGNAVPPVLGKAIAASIRRSF